MLILGFRPPEFVETLAKSWDHSHRFLHKQRVMINILLVKVLTIMNKNSHNSSVKACRNIIAKIYNSINCFITNPVLNFEKGFKFFMKIIKEEWKRWKTIEFCKVLVEIVHQNFRSITHRKRIFKIELWLVFWIVYI